MNEIYVVGHRNPDTDSIVAAMSYAALRNALGDRDYVAAYLGHVLSLIHISEPTRLGMISYAVFCLKKKKNRRKTKTKSK